MRTTKILFVCSANIDRSPTAERIYANHPELEVKSAGTSRFAQKPVSAELVSWADVILCMENGHQQFIKNEYPDIITHKKIDALHVPDNYSYMEPALQKIIKEKVDEWLESHIDMK